MAKLYSEGCACNLLELGAVLGSIEGDIERWSLHNYDFIIKHLEPSGPKRDKLDNKWSDEVIFPLLEKLRGPARDVSKACGAEILLPEGQKDSRLFPTRFVDDPGDDVDSFLKYVAEQLGC